MKKLLFTISFLLWSVIVFAQTHTVARGETLQSIAAKYNLTELQLIEANPGADKLFYVGLKLNIPEFTQTTTESVVSQTNQEIKKHDPSENIINKDTEDSNDKPGFTFGLLLEYGFLPKTEGVKGTNFAYSVTIGTNYYFMHDSAGVFAGARIGYNSANYNTLMNFGYGSYINTTSEAHFITLLPIHAGYSFSTKNRKLVVSPCAGIGMNFCVGGKFKLKNIGHGSSEQYKTKFEKNVGIDTRIGAQLKIYGINVGLAYIIPLNKSQKSYFGKDSYFAINLGIGF